MSLCPIDSKTRTWSPHRMAFILLMSCCHLSRGFLKKVLLVILCHLRLKFVLCDFITRGDVSFRSARSALQVCLCHRVASLPQRHYYLPLLHTAQGWESSAVLFKACCSQRLLPFHPDQNKSTFCPDLIIMLRYRTALIWTALWQWIEARGGT